MSMLLKPVDCSIKWGSLKHILDYSWHIIIVFAAAEQFLFNVQIVDITVQEAVKGSILLVSHLKSYRTDKMFHQFYEKTLSQSESLTEPPKPPRTCKLPKQLGSGSPAHQHHCTRDLHRQAYYEALDLVSEEVSRRLQQEEIELLMFNTAN